MNKFLGFLSGKKTYIAAVGMIGLGAFLISQGQTDQGMARILEGLAIIGGRSALYKIGQ